MDNAYDRIIEEAESAALEILRHNARGPFEGLPRTAGWGYPEPYTRDLLISLLGIAVSDDGMLLAQMGKVLARLADNQSLHGQIPSLVHEKENTGASDTTPLFLLALAVYRQTTGEPDFLAAAAEKALGWMDYQSPTDKELIGQLPTTDWRDEQWVNGYGLYVNSLAYSYLRFYGNREKSEGMLRAFKRFDITGEKKHAHVHSRLREESKPYLSFWVFKIYSSERFDLLGNSIAILSGLVARDRAKKIVFWIEKECEALVRRGELAIELAPNFFPFMTPGDPDWLDRYGEFNLPGDYHNGGIWPFVSGFHIAAIVAAGEYELAERKLAVLTRVIKKASDSKLSYGFNEWIKAQDGKPRGQDWQTWSASMYLYAAHCVRERKTVFFDFIA